jgi:hypothetical protein
MMRILVAYSLIVLLLGFAFGIVAHYRRRRKRHRDIMRGRTRANW